MSASSPPVVCAYPNNINTCNGNANEDEIKVTVEEVNYNKDDDDGDDGEEEEDDDYDDYDMDDYNDYPRISGSEDDDAWAGVLGDDGNLIT